MVLRLIQGFGLGGEYGGAALMTNRISARIPTRILGSLPQTGCVCGIMLATGIFALCNHFLTSEQFLSWGWRIPFWLSAVMLIVGLFIRLHTEENAGFSKAKNDE